MADDNEHVRSAILEVLEDARCGRVRNDDGSYRQAKEPHYIATYQVLRRLQEPLRHALIEKHGMPGKGAGRHSTVATYLASMLNSLGDLVETDWIDAEGVLFQIDPALPLIDPGSLTIKVYRLKRS